MLELGSDDAYYLGPDLVLRECTFVLRTDARVLTVMRTKLIGCTVEAKKTSEADRLIAWSTRSGS